MTNILQKNKYLILIGIAISALVVGLIWGNYTQIEKVNGYSTLNDSCKTATATSTPVGVFNVPNLNWLTPGTGTTTLFCRTDSAKNMKVLLWEVASSTRTTYNMAISDSQDGVDYYERGGSLLEFNQNSTTTNLVSNSVLIHQFASSTIEAQQNVGFYGRGTTSAKLISFEIPTLGAKFVKVTYFLTGNLGTGEAIATSTNGALWSGFVNNVEQ